MQITVSQNITDGFNYLHSMITPEEVKAKTIERFWSKIKIGESDDCWEWQANLTKRGYGRFSIGRKVEGQTHAHRYMAMKLFADFDENLFACHTCDNPKCCNPNHIFMGTHTENMIDKVKKGRANHWIGSDISTAKLNEKAIPDIRNKILIGMRRQDIAEQYGVCRQIIDGIANGKRWKHVQ